MAPSIGSNWLAVPLAADDRRDRADPVRPRQAFHLRLEAEQGAATLRRTRALRWLASSSIVVKYEAPCLYRYDRSAAAVRAMADSVRFRREWGVTWARSRRTEFPYAPSVILTKVRTQGKTGLRSVTLDPDFRQDDGTGVGMCGAVGIP